MRPWLLAFLVALAVVVPRADATVMIPVPFEQLVHDAAGIVHARVVRSGVQMVIHPSGDSLDPYTVTTLEVLDWYKGEGPERITLREEGGRYRRDGRWLEQRITGMPRYAVGDEVIVFLAPGESPSHYRTLEMVQGKFVVLTATPGAEPVVTRDMRDVAFLRPGNFGLRTLRHGSRESIGLFEFQEMIAEALGLRSGPESGAVEASR